jgi:Tfp pilus assembly protein PilF
MFFSYFKQPLLLFWTFIVIVLAILGIVLLTIGGTQPAPTHKVFQNLSSKEIIQIRQNLALLPDLSKQDISIWKKNFIKILIHDKSNTLTQISQGYLTQLETAAKALSPNESTLIIQSQKQALYSLGDDLINLETR